MKECFPLQSRPTDFRFGVADADLQVIGEKIARSEEKSEESMWSWFARATDKCHQSTGPELGIDRFSHWEKDINLMRELGLKHYRTSVSMSRLLNRDGGINAKAAHWYETYFKSLRRAGISVYATLYHWELPQFLNEQGGWKNRIMVEWLSKHAAAVFETLGEHINEYFILNEPWCSSFLGYHQGIHAPGETNLMSAFTAAHNLLLAQGLAFEKLKSLDRNLKVSTVLNLCPCYAASNSEQDHRAAQYADVYHNTWFLEPIFNGRYPDEAREVFASKLPHFSKSDMTLINIGPRLNSLGINYYNGAIVKYDEHSETRFASVRKNGEKVSDLNWPIFVPPTHREGLYDILQQVWYSYRRSGLNQIYITENGMAESSAELSKDSTVNDSRRVEYLEAHISQMAAAIERGIPVKAYFAWTLMDNYEWQEGHRPESCFGLVHVDRKTMRRTKKSSALWYSALIAGTSTKEIRNNDKATERPAVIEKPTVIKEMTVIPTPPATSKPQVIIRRAQPKPQVKSQPAKPHKASSHKKNKKVVRKGR